MQKPLLCLQYLLLRASFPRQCRYQSWLSVPPPLDQGRVLVAAQALPPPLHLAFLNVKIRLFSLPSLSLLFRNALNVLGLLGELPWMGLLSGDRTNKFDQLLSL